MKEKKYEAYENAVRQVWMDGAVSLDEADMIEALRKSLNITLEEHAEIEAKIRHELEHLKSPEGDSGGAETPSSPSIPEIGTPEIINESSDDSAPDDELAEAIGDISAEDLTKDLDDLSKSIDKLGQKLGRPGITDSLDSTDAEKSDESTKPAGGTRGGLNLNSSSKFGALSLKIQPDKPTIGDDDIQDEDLSSDKSDNGLADLEPEESEESEGAEGKVSGSDLLSQLKQQYELDKTGEVTDDSKEEPEVKEQAEEEKPSEVSAKESELSIDEEDLVTLDDFLEAGKIASREKKYQAALKYYKSALQIDPDNKEVKFFIRKVATELKKSKEPPSEPEKPKEEDMEEPPEEEEEPVKEELKEKPTEAAKPKRKVKKLKKKKKKVKSKKAEAAEPDVETEESPAEEPTVTKSEDAEPLGEIKDKVKVPAVKEEAEPEPVGDGSCAICGGTKKCNWCKGSKECYWCYGSGKCTKCNGEKEIDGSPCQACDGEGLCGSCEGSGECTWCKGSGKCNTCSM
ncbi:MAG: hypothetical protein JSV49_06425 [Thermoplasmata archaeon]|nr:MAG: hypothetical protein JSV49_06425 [Thermoplasmata archaeon]